MKVTFCSWDKPDFCIAQNIWLQRLLPELRKHGIECQVLFLTIGQPEECPTVNALLREGFICHATASLGSTRNFVHWILKKLAKNPPDVFVPNHVVPAYFAGRWVSEAGIPTVGVLHSEDNLSKGLIKQFGSGDNNFDVSSFVGVSKYITEMAHEKLARKIRVEHIPCGVPLPSIVASYPTGSFRLVYVGRLVEEAKRISEVTRALCQAVQEVPNVEAVIYGEGSARQTVEKILRERAEGLPVRLEGPVENSQIYEHLAQSHSIVLLSDSEGTPISVMEAMACGVVPICLRLRGGVGELVENNVTGLLVDDTKGSFVTAVRQLREAPELWSRLSVSARNKIEEGFSIELSASKWEYLLRHLCRGANTNRPIKVPVFLSLPPVLPELDSRDPRKAFYFHVPLLLRHRIVRLMWRLRCVLQRLQKAK